MFTAISIPFQCLPCFLFALLNKTLPQVCVGRFTIKKAALCTRTTAYNRTPSGDFKIIGHPKMTCSGAENETRTRDPNLGKVVLYQLSYFRRFVPLLFVWDCKGTNILLISKLFCKNLMFFHQDVRFVCLYADGVMPS